MTHTFQSLGDGNCFYNSFMVRLAYDQLNQTMPMTSQYRTQLKALFSHLSKFNAEIDLHEELAVEEWQKEQIDSAFQKVFKQCQIDETTIDWVAYQHIMGPVLREFVIDNIENNSEIHAKVIQELKTHLNGSLEFSTKDDLQLSGYFQGMPEIALKVAELAKLDTPLAERQKQLTDWFIDGEEKLGYAAFLRGEKGIALDTIHAGKLEIMVLTDLFNIDCQYKTTYESATNLLLHGFEEEQRIRANSKKAKIYDNEAYSLKYHAGSHWDLYLPEDATSKQICDDYAPQRIQYNEEKSRQIARQEAAAQLKRHGSYEAHRQADKVDDQPLSIEEYCALYQITRTEYDQNLFPGQKPQPKPSAEPQSQPQTHSEEQTPPLQAASSASQQKQTEETNPAARQAAPDVRMPAREPIRTTNQNPYRGMFNFAACFMIMASLAALKFLTLAPLAFSLLTIASISSISFLAINLKDTLYLPKPVETPNSNTPQSRPTAGDDLTREAALRASAPPVQFSRPNGSAAPNSTTPEDLQPDQSLAQGSVTASKLK